MTEAETGRVVFAGPFEGYGPTVVLDHGAGYYTVYLYLDRVTAKQGDVVRRGQSLGTVGGPAVGEGPHIEFQVRLPGGRAADPAPLLQSLR